MPNVSYSDYELKPSKKSDNTYVIKKIIDKRTVKKQVQYLVWFKNYLKKEATWVPKKKLIEDNATEYIQQFEDEYNKKKYDKYKKNKTKF
jgi:chromobox protein 5